MNLVDMAALSTVRLEGIAPDGSSSVGTGYFFKWQHPSLSQHCPAIITNKHVVDGCSHIKAIFWVTDASITPRSDGSVEVQDKVELLIEVGGFNVVRHPSAEVDLCFLPLVSFLEQLPRGKVLKNVFLDKGWLLTPEERAHLRSVEPIVMIGYPNGLWDELNNRPIARKGVTASHALVKWNGKQEFMIDAACFPGSSGSPVFLHEDGLYSLPDGSYTPGARMRLLGTLWGGPTYTAQGHMEQRNIPTAVQVVAVTPLMLNLGFVIQADALDELFSVICNP